MRVGVVMRGVLAMQLLLVACGMGRGTMGADGESGETENDETGRFDVAGMLDVEEEGATVRVAFATGAEHHVCAGDAAGTVWCWGGNAWGELGLGVSAPEVCRDAVSATCRSDAACCVGDGEALTEAGELELVEAAQLASTVWTTCARTEDGEVTCWGVGALGLPGVSEVGFDEPAGAYGPIDLGAPAIWIGAMAGDNSPGPLEFSAEHNKHVCALLLDQTVRCWGDDGMGRLGYGVPGNVGYSNTPAEAGPVPVGGPVADLAVGGAHTCALLEGGLVRCWGFNGNGELGLGVKADVVCKPWLSTCAENCCFGKEEPAELVPFVELGELAVEIEAGPFSTCARLESGDVRCWGKRTRFGDDPIVGDDELPSSVPPVDYGGPVRTLEGGRGECAVLVSGEVGCRTQDAPELIDVGGPVRALAFGWVRCAIREDERLVCWGSNGHAQLGRPIPDPCYDEDGRFDCTLASTCCAGDDETPAAWGPVPL